MQLARVCTHVRGSQRARSLVVATHVLKRSSNKMRVRHLEKQQLKRDAARAALPKPEVKAKITLNSSGLARISLTPAGYTEPPPAPVDDAVILAQAVLTASSTVSKLLEKPAQTAPAQAASPPTSPERRSSWTNISHSLPWKDGFALVSETGWAKMGDALRLQAKGHYSIQRYPSELEAMKAAALLWCNWVLYREERDAYVEITSGGVGFACYAVRRYVKTLEVQKRDMRRASRGEPPPKVVAPAPAVDETTIEAEIEAEIDPMNAVYDT